MANVINNSATAIIGSKTNVHHQEQQQRQQEESEQHLNQHQISDGNNSSGISSLRDISNFLQSTNAQYAGQDCPYNHIVDLLRGLDLHDDGIVMNHKIKSILTDFCNIILDEDMLNESMEYINDRALEDGNTAMKFALLFSSHNFDALAMKETKVRSAMLRLLETNFMKANDYRSQSKDRLYNSITLLGEYYHRVRLADNSPIAILGESLLGLLINEITEFGSSMDYKLARLILSQVTLNGDLLRKKHQTEVGQLLYHIRCILIEQNHLRSAVKALLLMTLDLFYNNFSNIGTDLEVMYTKYLGRENEDEGNNNRTVESQDQSPHNGLHGGESQPTAKKWSEQVCEDSLCENEYPDDVASRDHSWSEVREGEELNQTVNKRHSRGKSGGGLGFNNRSNRRSNRRNQDVNEEQDQQQNFVDETEESRPQSHWQGSRLKRDDRMQRRLSGCYDDDNDSQSVRSEGGNIRLYTISDRLKHSQEKFERYMGSQKNSIVNSNWDRQSQRDDRSERSYVSNYERGNHNRRTGNGHGGHGGGGSGGGRRFNNRHAYDKPPRFQKNQQPQPPLSQYQEPNGSHGDSRIQSESWRRSRTNSNSNSFQDESGDYHHQRNQNGPLDTRSLPRPHKKSHLDEGGPNGGQRPFNANYRRSQSPTHSQYQRGGGRYNRSHYSSQNSLASENSSSFNRHKPNANHNNYQPRSFGRHGSPQGRQYRKADNNNRQGENWDNECMRRNEASGSAASREMWSPKDKDSELVRNARQTTKYMNYLSSQNE